ncbi:MAG: BPL-N domain-containing protein [Desulfovibrio sp.]
MTKQKIYIYWDESHFWGLLLLHALDAWNIPYQLMRGNEIAQGALTGKFSDASKAEKNGSSLLIVPGGNARLKAMRLGKAGIKAIRNFVAEGGTYLGFCGGAGLALTGGGLSLCPWTRKPFNDRLKHLVSGHLHLSLNEENIFVPQELKNERTETALLPVWWPGRFAEDDNPDVAVLARYKKPGTDLFVADINIHSLPEETLADWENLYGIHFKPDFIQGNAAILTGAYGEGRYFISYPHLETPASPQANHWLSFLLDTILGQDVQKRPAIPQWDILNLPQNFTHPALTDARTAFLDILATGQENFLLFWRNPWLLGWRRGIPGSGLTSLLALTCEILRFHPTEEALLFWEKRNKAFSKNLELFHKGFTGFLLAERLAMTLPSQPEIVPAKALVDQRRALFGPPPCSGGLYAELVSDLEELAGILFSTHGIT